MFVVVWLSFQPRKQKGSLFLNYIAISVISRQTFIYSWDSMMCWIYRIQDMNYMFSKKNAISTVITEESFLVLGSEYLVMGTLLV